MKKICIIGAGGFATEVLWTIKDAIPNPPSYCFAVSDEYYTGDNIRVIRLGEVEKEKYSVLIAIADPRARKRIAGSLDVDYATIIHPSAILSDDVRMGFDTIIQAGCILTLNISLGNHCQLNLHTTIGHDCRIGDYFTSAPGVRISGNCTIGECVYMGTNAIVKERVSICDDVVIGMGSVVLKDITDPGTYVGNPLRKL